MIKRLPQFHFSPTGSTRDLVDKAAETLAGRLKLPLSYDSFTLPKDQRRSADLRKKPSWFSACPPMLAACPIKALPF